VAVRRRHRCIRVLIREPKTEIPDKGAIWGKQIGNPGIKAPIRWVKWKSRLKHPPAQGASEMRSWSFNRVNSRWSSRDLTRLQPLDIVLTSRTPQYGTTTWTWSLATFPHRDRELVTPSQSTVPNHAHEPSPLANPAFRIWGSRPTERSGPFSVLRSDPAARDQTTIGSLRLRTEGGDHPKGARASNSAGAIVP